MSTFNKLFLALLLVCFSESGQSGLITKNGVDVSFTYEDFQLGIYGLPRVSGDTVFFVSTISQALSKNGTGTQNTGSMVKITSNALPGVSIISADLAEREGYILQGENAASAVKGALALVDVADPLPVYVSKITPTAAIPLPLPLAVWLFGGGLMSLLFVSKRKKIM